MFEASLREVRRMLGGYLGVCLGGGLGVVWVEVGGQGDGLGEVCEQFRGVWVWSRFPQGFRRDSEEPQAGSVWAGTEVCVNTTHSKNGCGRPSFRAG